jgi:hypothetical protein
MRLNGINDSLFVNGTGLKQVHNRLHGWTFNTFFLYTNLNIKGVCVCVDDFFLYTFIFFKLFKLSLSCINVYCLTFFLNFRQSIFLILFRPFCIKRSLSLHIQTRTFRSDHPDIFACLVMPIANCKYILLYNQTFLQYTAMLNW